jgi:hypothetical protein
MKRWRLQVKNLDQSLVLADSVFVESELPAMMTALTSSLVRNDAPHSLKVEIDQLTNAGGSWGGS